MGFRTNFIAEYSGYTIPQWFKDKYKDWKFDDGVFAQLYESKFYDRFKDDERILDIQKMLVEDNKDWDGDEIKLVLLHECGGITRVSVGRNKITAQEPTEWKKVEQVEHDYCYGCSDDKTMTRETNTHHQQYNLNEKLTKIKELFQQKSPDNWYIDDDISSWFDHDTVNNEKPIEFTPYQ